MTLQCPHCGVSVSGDIGEVNDWAEQHVSGCDGWAPPTRVLP